MNRTLLLIMILTLFSCKNSARRPENNIDTSTYLTENKQPDVISGNDKDIVYISTDSADTLAYLKGDLRRILKALPELTDEIPNSPDESYARVKNLSIDLSGKDNVFSLNCELCKDNYYRLYGYFLKMH